MTSDNGHLPSNPDHKPPGFLSSLFWDCDPTALDTDHYAAFIQGRIMERGSWAAMQWLLRRYGPKNLADFLLTKGYKTLAARELNYWALLCNIEPTTRRRMVQCATNWSGAKK
ncbi:MAG: hypothetical protein BWK76_21895 [Desulfobulbaceae bacterium A2]|nr:MAG: hypothetical protein BWK76_21895 [Desulfobulbaceae bacterium A2]